MAQKTGIRFQVESCQKLLKWYLIPPFLTLCIIKYISRVMWSHPGKGIAPFPTRWCSSYWKGSLWVTFDYSRQLYFYINANMDPWWVGTWLNIFPTTKKPNIWFFNFFNQCYRSVILCYRSVIFCGWLCYYGNFSGFWLFAQIYKIQYSCQFGLKRQCLSMF